MLSDPVIERIAGAVGRSPAQVVLRWHIQRGDIVFPKSVSPKRKKSNFELFDFELGSSAMDAISALDQGESGRTGPNPDKVRPHRIAKRLRGESQRAATSRFRLDL